MGAHRTPQHKAEAERRMAREARERSRRERSELKRERRHARRHSAGFDAILVAEDEGRL